MTARHCEYELWIYLFLGFLTHPRFSFLIKKDDFNISHDQVFRCYKVLGGRQAGGQVTTNGQPTMIQCLKAGWNHIVHIRNVEIYFPHFHCLFGPTKQNKSENVYLCPFPQQVAAC